MPIKFRPITFAPVWLVILSFMFVPASTAQDTLVPDRFDLASRLLDFSGEPTIPMPSPAYAPGDTADFWVSKDGSDVPVQITAKLAGIGYEVYVWVEDGIAYNPDTTQQLADLLGNLWAVFRIRGNYPQVTIAPQTSRELAVMSLYTLPDVDNDPNLYILFTRDLAGQQATAYNPADSLSPELAPGGYTNQHEMIYVDTSSFPGSDLSDGAYVSALILEFYNILKDYNNPGQAAWLADALSWYMLLYSQGNTIGQNEVQTYFATPEVPLMQQSTPGFSAQQLFLNYLSQRFGPNILVSLAGGSGAGLTALDNALRDNGIIDPSTGEVMTGRDVFADFVLANAINGFFGDGRYLHLLEGAQGLRAQSVAASDQFDFDIPTQVVGQFGTQNFVLQTTRPVDFTLYFNGQSTVPRLPMQNEDTTNRFYWSGNTPNRDATLTRAFDLSGVDEATLNFDAWYILSEDRNYAYVEVSEDGGATWDILPTTDTVSTNPYGLNYGDGFTGISNTESIRPFPYVGVVLDTDGITVLDIPADGPLAATDLQQGDQIIGHDGEPWADQPDFINFLSGFEPGDTVNLYVQRGDETFDLEVTLTEHPQRLRIPDALWLPQSVDLSAYSGKSVLVRFEAINLPGETDSGIAIDNIAVPETGFLDDAESTVPGWTLNGWQQTTNEVPQRFLLQAAQVGQNNVRVTQLISPSDTTTQGFWTFSLEANQVLVLTVSGMNDNTFAPAQFSISARAQPQPNEQEDSGEEPGAPSI